jgi:DNA-binding LacI/PurR family transcriptional regulator
MGEPFFKVTRADVAKHAGVSETIVSYVINHNRYVKNEKRLAVEKSIQELHYKPNNIARALKGKASNQILFIADHISNEHFGRIIYEMDNYAYEKGFLVSLCANRNSDEFISRIISHQVDGVVISSVSFSEKYIDKLAEAGIPLVLLLVRNYSHIPENVVIIDTGLYQGAQTAILHLASKNRCHIVYIDRISSQNHYGNMDDHRYRGFVEQMELLGLELTEQNFVTGCTSEAEVFDATQHLVLSGYPVDGIFGRNDSLACIAIQAVQQLGKRVPEDISVVGFDNTNLSRFMTPSLSTVEIQRDEIGRLTINMLSKMMQRKVLENAALKTIFIERNSS